jgi:hypothetical protein
MSSPKHAPSLPLEVYDEITDHLYGDKATLKSCSLTCKAWLKRARYNLFFEFVVRPRDFPSIIDYLDSSSCHIRPFIRLLILKRMDAVQGGMATEDGIVMLHLPVLMSLLPSVQTIRFSEFRFPRLGLKHRSEFFNNFRDIKNVELFGIVIDTVDELIDIIGAFASLETLTLSGCWLRRYDKPSFSKLANTSRLRIHIFEQRPQTSSRCFVQWLLKQDKIPVLKSLQYKIADVETKYELQELLYKAGQSLEYFHVDIPYGRLHLSRTSIPSF